MSWEQIKNDDVEDKIIDEREDDFEYFTKYPDCTIAVESKGAARKCGWCGIELTNSELGV